MNKKESNEQIFDLAGACTFFDVCARIGPFARLDLLLLLLLLLLLSVEERNLAATRVQIPAKELNHTLIARHINETRCFICSELRLYTF